MKFSVLMSIYCNEQASQFNRAMSSIWDEQTVKPNEIVLVQDGPLDDSLYVAIHYWKSKIGETFKTIPLKENIGLGDALNIGLQECSYELVARMDTDDICLKDRFEKQLEIFRSQHIAVCGCWVSEFDNDENIITSYRKTPKLHMDIIRFCKKRNPVNHPTAMYKKSDVQMAGGYKRMMWLEDYYLWVRMMIIGKKFYNIQQPLVKMRAGYQQLERRRGFKYLLSELELHNEFLRLGFVNVFEFVGNMTIRLLVRVLPKKLVSLVYKRLRR
jgi:glycosyltransferase involved in cell wall biosynthesis